MSAQYRLEDFHTSKSNVKRTFETWYDRPDDDQWSNDVKALLAARRAYFTLDEIEILLDVFNTSHHQCVLENENDYPPLVVATHKRLDERILSRDREVMRLRTETARLMALQALDVTQQ